MNFSALKYLSKQGVHNLVRNRMMSVASVGVLTACLVITGIAALLSANVSSFVDYLGAQHKVIVYLNLDATEEQANAANAAIAATPNITEFSYTSKQDALDRTKEWISGYDEGAYAGVLDGYEGENNPLYASFSVTVTDLTAIETTVAALSSIEGVDFVDSPSELASTLVALKQTASVAGWGLVAILGVVAIVVISNTIRITVFARRKEINIMKFVGATNSFIRLPFWVEGTLIGAIAALLSFGIVSGLYVWVLRLATTSGISWLQSIYFTLLPYESIWVYLLGGFVGAGVVLGGLGSSLSIRKHLKV